MKLTDTVIVTSPDRPSTYRKFVLCVGDKWQHYKGTIYTITGLGRKLSLPADNDFDHDELVDYEDESGNGYSAPYSYFCSPLGNDKLRFCKVGTMTNLPEIPKALVIEQIERRIEDLRQLQDRAPNDRFTTGKLHGLIEALGVLQGKIIFGVAAEKLGMWTKVEETNDV
jgi:hypothetical protein